MRAKDIAEQGIEIEVDRLTASVINQTTGDVLTTVVLPVDTRDRKSLRSSWNFDWMRESRLHEVYKLCIEGNPSIIQGLISLQEGDDHVVIRLIENASHNIGKAKAYAGVAGNLFAFACRYSFQTDHNGYVAFQAKNQLIQHYQETLGAIRIGTSQLLILDEHAARKLIRQYFHEEP